MQITTASVHDVNVLDNLQYEMGSFYILDRGYVDFSRLHNTHLQKAILSYVPKATLDLSVCAQMLLIKRPVCSDQIVVLEVHQSKYDYPNKVRRIKYHDKELGRDFVFISNNMDLEAFKNCSIV